MKTPNPPVSLAIVNRNYPTRVGVTGESACRLAAFLQDQHNVQISIFTTSGDYEGGGSALSPIGEVKAIRPLYNGKNKLLRLFASFIESFLLIRSAKSCKADHIIVMTDPPFLHFWASLLLSDKRAWTLWAMDLFPQAFVAGKLVTPNNPAYRILKFLTYKKSPNGLIALGPLQAKHIQEAFQKPPKKVFIIPCGVFENSTDTKSVSTPDWKRSCNGKIALGYCGNLGEAHSAKFLKQIINHFDRSRFELVLSLYGVRADELINHAKTKMEGITIVPRVEREQLHFIDIHLVSLMRRWAHVCVPSKAISAICSGSSILFYGEANCDNWKMLGSAGWLIQQNDDEEAMADEIQRFFKDLTLQNVICQKSNAREIAKRLNTQVNIGYSRVAQSIMPPGKQVADTSAPLQPPQTIPIAPTLYPITGQYQPHNID